MKSNTCLLTFAALLLGLCSESHAQFACTADLSALGQGPQRIEITTNTDGSFTAMTDGTVTNAKGVVVEERIRPNLNMTADPSSSEFVSYNSAERSLIHLYVLIGGPAKALIKIPFDPVDVRLIKTFDLVGRTDKFGGKVLLEAFTESGKPLGRVVRAVLPVACE